MMINKKWLRDSEKAAEVDGVEIRTIDNYRQTGKYQYSAIKLFINGFDITNKIIKNSKSCPQYDKDGNTTLIVKKDDLKQELLKCYLIIEKLRSNINI